MDIAPKAAFLSAVVLPGERTAVMGFISVVRTASQSCGPVITGVLAQRGSWWLKAVYDLGLLTGFRGHKTNEDRAEERRKRKDEDESDT
jgi:MFS family permease